ncbi:hypothetical protein GW17_00025573 [Ensete ventricosum]|nr:hypothetical protein GW17_00025573 [Ensete ventricosum]
MILPLENHDLSLLDICVVGVTFLFPFFPLEVSETTIPLDYSVLLNKLCIVIAPQMHLLDCDSSPIQPPLHPSREKKLPTGYGLRGRRGLQVFFSLFFFLPPSADFA